MRPAVPVTKARAIVVEYLVERGDGPQTLIFLDKRHVQSFRYWLNGVCQKSVGVKLGIETPYCYMRYLPR